jgi:hypothetical protein
MKLQRKKLIKKSFTDFFGSVSLSMSLHVEQRQRTFHSIVVVRTRCGRQKIISLIEFTFYLDKKNESAIDASVDDSFKRRLWCVVQGTATC